MQGMADNGVNVVDLDQSMCGQSVTHTISISLLICCYACELFSSLIQRVAVKSPFISDSGEESH